MDRVLIRLTQLRWHIYRRPEIAIEILTKISIEINNFVHERTLQTWGLLMKNRGVRRSQSLPNLGSSSKNV
jgi:hypothetical protein